MSEPRHTCFGCPHVDTMAMPLGGCVVYCTKTNAMVPQHWQSHPPRITYWRVPMNCPLPDTEVIKSAEKAPEDLWQIENLEVQP